MVAERYAVWQNHRVDRPEFGVEFRENAIQMTVSFFLERAGNEQDYRDKYQVIIVDPLTLKVSTGTQLIKFSPVS